MNARPPSSHTYPWYDSVWLHHFTRARAIIGEFKPSALNAFDDAMKVFRTPADFRVKRFDRVFDDDTLTQIRALVRTLKPTDFELHEVQQFKRFVVHDHPWLTELQQQLTDFVSTAAGEPVDANYNFLSLYSSLGVCPVHMDSPEAKWTLDLCLNQTEPWPIYFSDVQPWPELDPHATPDAETPMWLGDDWERAIKRSPSMGFEAHVMEPGQAIMFSGSSQWHYRDAMPARSTRSSCDLLFFHFIPRGTRKLVKSANWAEMFDVPELASISDVQPAALITTPAPLAKESTKKQALGQPRD